MDTSPLVNWLNKELSSLLECEIGDEYSKNILNIETEPELKEFIGSLLDLSIAKNRIFLDELLKKIKKPSHHTDVKVYVKPDLDEPVRTKGNNKTKSNQATSSSTQDNAQSKQGKKSGFSLVPVDNSNTKGVANRRKCNCQAAKHPLVGNCLKCGRIVCEQEGSGPCSFCGNLVCTREETEKIARASIKGEQLKRDLMAKTWSGFEAISESLENMKVSSEVTSAGDAERLRQAIEHKNKLIEFDRTSAKRTQVIDDESDYFSTNSRWITSKQKALLDVKEAELRDKRFGSRLTKTFAFDFAGRKVADEQQDMSFQKYASEIENILNDQSNSNYISESIAKHEKDLFSPIFIEGENLKTKKPPKWVEPKATEAASKPPTFRLQDQELQEMRDDGMCLSMHQPYASLLVQGIKIHEGRTWYTPYRGRLWIHAASKQPTESDVKEVEVFYKVLYSPKTIKFPSSYPTSCLIGYVDLNDCLSSETYRNKFPNGESQSEFVFICGNPRELAFKIPMPGEHKIFKLDKNVIGIARKTTVVIHDENQLNKNEDAYDNQDEDI